MFYKFLLTSFFLVFSFGNPIVKIVTDKNIEKAIIEEEDDAERIYYSLESNNLSLPDFESFSVGLKGYKKLKESGKLHNDYLTIIDFSMSSSQKRLWVIDMNQNKIIYNSLVAHGSNSGGLYARKFSNADDSNKSSLGFYLTGEIYHGKHGLSLKLDGLEKGINDKARQRSIVMHGADYVSNQYIKNHKALGRSQGCPALPVKMNGKIISLIKNKSCLFIYYPTKNYLTNSKLIS